MHPEIHGTRREEGSAHPVLDLALWESRFPLEEPYRLDTLVESAGDIALREQARRRALANGDMGSSVPVDLFVWADTVLQDRPWLTRIGGVPWRKAGLAWPVDEDGIPLTFLGQVCFADSRDLLKCELPGDVVLLFGTWDAGWATPGVIEWSPRVLTDPLRAISDIPRGGRLPFEYQGVRHRTVQYIRSEAAEGACRSAGFENGSWGIGALQATSIGAYAGLPQGWPFEDGDGCGLICTLSSFSFRGEWPLVDVPEAPRKVHGRGHTGELWNCDAMTLGIGDAGALYVYRDADGVFRLGGSHG